MRGAPRIAALRIVARAARRIARRIARRTAIRARATPFRAQFRRLAHKYLADKGLRAPQFRIAPLHYAQSRPILVQCRAGRARTPRAADRREAMQWL